MTRNILQSISVDHHHVYAVKGIVTTESTLLIHNDTDIYMMIIIHNNNLFTVSKCYKL
jgi:hypothetical protein